MTDTAADKMGTLSSESLQHRNVNRSKKRKQPNNNGGTLENAYKDVSFVSRASSGRPDSPHFLFSSSYAISSKTTISNTGENKEAVDKIETIRPLSDENKLFAMVPQVVHCHVNGLCVVTAGKVKEWLAKLYPKRTLQSVELVATEPPPCSAAEKRKRQSKMLRGGNVEHIVRPTSVIAKLKLTNNDNKDRSTEVPLYAGVWGTIVELNHGLNPQILLDDPLLDGHLAVILPSGRFPPPPNAT
ncbi:hypothetical protein IV203_025260 [Nitzschia inconspicua]|uniref:Uncharacterized protein n=1 Tax=Nitzschia inconspicua TaxID=303405 RepID=A0A9K3K9T8_9STRA|nr:hypothetical protein IV203_024734 [Nitzschia inconspicua]KAG7362376.1 hypothetical protein IV203_025260 [Nitzschia inconspicua]